MPPDYITIAVTRVDGGCTILQWITAEYDADGTKRWERTASRDAIQRTINKYIESGIWNENNGKLPVDWRIVTSEFADGDRTYRNAWKDTGRDKPEHDMVKARDVHRDIMRRGRQKELDALDIEAMVADEAGNAARKREVAERKQKLRDVTADPRIEAAQTVEELKMLTLEELLK